jgi:predicted amidophosphoribosyltransferase
MQLCQSCQQELPEEGFFCTSCGIQVRCKECKEIVQTNARFCGNCGISLSNLGKGEPNITPASDSPAHNVVDYKYEKGDTNIHLHTKFSDKVGVVLEMR